MKNTLIIVSLILIAGVILAFFVIDKKENDAQNYNSFPINYDFYYPEQFLNTISNLDQTELQEVGDVKGGILPHHLVPFEQITKYYAQLSQSRQPQTIILIGPDHKDRNLYGAVISDYAWETEFGLLEPDEEIVNKIIKTELVNLDNQSFSNEHSILSHVNFIKYFFPETKIVPIIFRSDYTKKDALELGREISNLLDDETIILASIDFSHYLNSDEAVYYDAITIETMENFDYDTLYTYDDKYFDTRPGMVTILKSMDLINAKNFNVFYNSNSGLIVNDPQSDTTSYFLIYFTK